MAVEKDGFANLSELGGGTSNSRLDVMCQGQVLRKEHAKVLVH